MGPVFVGCFCGGETDVTGPLLPGQELSDHEGGVRMAIKGRLAGQILQGLRE